jgi:predicted  nucleic acid-binding Zn-ribbon protein
MPDTKDAYVRKLKAKIDEWNAEIDALAAKTEQEHPELKTQCRQKAEVLQAKIKDAEDKIVAAHDAGEAAWEELKQGMRSSLQTWKDSFAKAKREFDKGFSQGRKK